MRYTITINLLLCLLAGSIPASDGKAITRSWIARDDADYSDPGYPGSPYASCAQPRDKEIAGRGDIYSRANEGNSNPAYKDSPPSARNNNLAPDTKETTRVYQR
ncbi:hypothetical protein K491DRAFT_684109 [Lophiostoma macrostomum CBS 122681]|uniref:Uncharacterized protein n=1 Tax=Lophiostoma macrostomum CBS 122681 TaxID=1314788 RepID=A0A6A6SNP4_9PLEO|nr:hypothetical protein K491DRAFT_684109 [Lophiostoma macrostomum CBS 122681]